MHRETKCPANPIVPEQNRVADRERAENQRSIAVLSAILLGKLGIYRYTSLVPWRGIYSDVPDKFKATFTNTVKLEAVA
jgi:hypothetical protein